MHSDLKTLKGVAAAWKDIKHGEYKKLSVDEFSKEIDRG